MSLQANKIVSHNSPRAPVCLLLLAVVAVALIAGCAEKGLASKIEVLRAEQSEAIRQGDTALASDLDAQADALEAQMPAAKLEDDAAWTWAESVGGLLGTFVGGPAAGVLIGGLAAARRGRKQGAQTVARAIEAGKAAHPAFAQLFRVGPAHDAIKAAMAPDIAKAVAAVKSGDVPPDGAGA